jgi:hypothetical protein
MFFLTNSFQLEPSSITLDGHHDSVNLVKFNADLSLLLSGGKLFVCLLSLLLTIVSRQLWLYNHMGLGIL